MTRPSPQELLAETARLAYHLHWPLDTILDLEHADRRRFLAEADAMAGARSQHPGRPFEQESGAMAGEHPSPGWPFQES
jgi:hypothetical protein